MQIYAYQFILYFKSIIELRNGKGIDLLKVEFSFNTQKAFVLLSDLNGGRKHI